MPLCALRHWLTARQVTENDSYVEETRDCKTQIATLRSRMEVVRQQMQQRERCYKEIMSAKINKARKAELLEMLANSAVVSQRMLTWEEDVL